MDDARFDRTGAGDAAGGAVPAAGSTRASDPGEHDAVPDRDWTRRRHGRSDTPLLVHWVDEKGAVVRLISSSSHPGTDASRGA